MLELLTSLVLPLIVLMNFDQFEYFKTPFILSIMDESPHSATYDNFVDIWAIKIHLWHLFSISNQGFN